MLARRPPRGRRPASAVAQTVFARSLLSGGGQPFGDTAVARTGSAAMLRLRIGTVLALGRRTRRIGVARRCSRRGLRSSRSRLRGGRRGRRSSSRSRLRGGRRGCRGSSRGRSRRGRRCRRRGLGGFLHPAVTAAGTLAGCSGGRTVLAGGWPAARRRCSDEPVGAGAQTSRSMRSFRAPRGVGTSTCVPGGLPISARATGDSADSLPVARSASVGPTIVHV